MGVEERGGERYIDLVKAFRQVINKEGSYVETINGSQPFTKATPLISERNKISASLLNLEKSFGWNKKKEEEKPKTSKRDASDLI
ncbi:terminase [Fictibacillus enclensis]|uniref:terminase n=1 Tax=Fictibacillus enclensis TaxID=1017270 RepID=UPI00333D621F